MKRKYVRQIYALFGVFLFVLLPTANQANAASADRKLNEIGLQNTVTGTVEDQRTGEPLIGVSVIIKGTSQGTITDVEGNYRVEAPNDAILVFSFIGYAGKEVAVGNRTVVDVTLEESVSELNEVIVVGYGTQEKREVTGAISSVDEEQLAQRVPATVWEAFQGQMAGVQLNTGSGTPGAGASIRIRGTATFNGGTDPLYVVDGQPVNNIDDLNPNDIKSIEVLKDGASAAIYGSRSANGVILVTTKLGEAGKTNISVNYLRSFGQLRKMPQANAQERLLYDELRGQAINGGQNMYLDSLNTMYNRNNYWIDIYYRTAIKDQANVSISGGTDKTKFYTNIGFLSQQGIAPNSGYKRWNARLNIDHSLNDRVTAGVRMGMSYGELHNFVEGDEQNGISSVLIKGAYSSYLEPDGSYQVNNNSFRGRTNIFDYYNKLNDRNRNLRGNYFQYVEIGILDGLKFRAQAGVDFNYIRNTNIEPEFVGGQNTNVNAFFYSALDYNWIYENYFSYSKEFGDHSISGIAGASWQKWGRPEERIEGQLANSLIPTLNNFNGLEGVNLTNTFTRNQSDHALQSIYARANYSFKDKYLASATIRRDGSSRFGPDNRWGSFPSISLGWRFSEESFFQGQSIIDNGKIRAGWAVTGNERIGNRDFDFLLDIGNFYNGINGVGLTNRLGNPAIQWEETSQFNIGLELGLIGSRVNLTVDWYNKNTSELLADRPLPAQTGFEETRVNLGEVENKGIELGIQAVPVNTNGIKWETNFNFAYNKNTVKSIAGDVPIVTRDHRTEVGQSLGNLYGYKILGIYASDEANVDGIVANGNVSGAGDYIWQDTDGNGEIDGDDRVVLGNAYPKYFGGWRNSVSYKGFTFSFLFDYQFEVEVYNHFYQTMTNFTLNSWTPWPEIINNTFDVDNPNASAIFPDGARNQNLLGTGAPTSYSVQDASFIKLRNIKISYDLPANLIGKLGASRLTVYGSINNALVWTNYKGWDPEVSAGNANALNAGRDDGRYPRLREYLIGLNLNF